MTHDPLTALQAAVSATRAYQAELRPAPLPMPERRRQTTPSPASALDPEALGRLAAPTVSRLIARDIRERGELT